MKKLKDLNLNVIEDKSALTINGGHSCAGTLSSEGHEDTLIGYWETGDWNDEGCC